MKTLKLFLMGLLMAPGLSLAQNTFTHKVGTCDVYLLSEAQQGVSTKLLIGATPEMLKTYAPGGTVPNSMSAYMVRTPDRIILVDAGMGSKITDNLAALNVTPEQVNDILITHMHSDHIGGLLRRGELVFPKAQVYIAQPEADYWNQDQSRGGENARRVMDAYKDHLHFFQPGQLEGTTHEVIPGFKSIAAYGHTPGHTMFMLTSGDQQLLFWGDLTHAMAIQMPCPQVALTYDSNPEQAITIRKVVLEYVAKNNIPVAGMHIAFPGMGTIKNANKGYTFTPMK